MPYIHRHAFCYGPNNRKPKSSLLRSPIMLIMPCLFKIHFDTKPLACLIFLIACLLVYNKGYSPFQDPNPISHVQSTSLPSATELGNSA